MRLIIPIATMTLIAAIVLAHPVQAQFEVNPELNLVYQLDCATGLIYCTANTTDQVGWDQSIWRRLRIDPQGGKTLSEHHSWLPTPGAWRGTHSRGTARLRTDHGIALASIPEAVRQRARNEWPRQKRRLESLALALSLQLDSSDIEVLLESVSEWFAVDGADLQPVALIAAHATAAGSIATRDRTYLYVETTEQDDALNRLPVVVHEWTHGLLEQMPDTVGIEIVDAVRDSKSVCSVPAYQLLDEVLASIVGNGLAERELRDDTGFQLYLRLPGSFYADIAIDQLAKATLPLASEALSTNMRIDRAFMDAYIRKTDETLGTRCETLTLRLRSATIVQHRNEYDAAYGLIRNRLGIHNALLDVVTDGDGRDTAMARHKGLSGIVFSDAANIESLSALAPASVLSELALRARKDGAAVHAFPTNAHAEIYFIVGRDVDATNLAAVHFLAHHDQRFQGWWTPAVDSIPERDE